MQNTAPFGISKSVIIISGALVFSIILSGTVYLIMCRYDEVDLNDSANWDFESEEEKKKKKKRRKKKKKTPKRTKRKREIDDDDDLPPSELTW